ncbi:WAS/WASL-interacting protein family member 2-like isoform X2 [Manis pentadactyla]|uniref:WAS/WASL-interacting protein family member 2-like isoform X2 n=1 Tax=Manis pentadactyla TaxID=143292 RepID=UPI00255C3A9B|nr:WAS/WASL-interacting protein family member 2-like isoform X2 [Manis pentadactyla]
MAVFCNARGRREDGRMEGESRGRGKPGWDGNKANSQAGNEKKGVRVIVGRRLPPGLPASRPRQPPLPPLRSPSPSLANATAAARVRASPVCDSKAERIIRIMASPARSPHGSPELQSAPITRTIAGDPRLRFPRLKPREDAKQKKTNPGNGKGRVTEPGGHLRPPFLGSPPSLLSVRPGPDTPNFNTRAARPPVWHQEIEVSFSCLDGHIHLLDERFTK